MVAIDRNQLLVTALADLDIIQICIMSILKMQRLMR